MKNIKKVILVITLCATLNLNAYQNYAGAINGMQYEISRFEIEKENIEYLSYGRKQLYCVSIVLALAAFINKNWSFERKATFLSIAAGIHYPALLHYCLQKYLNNEIALRRKQIERLKTESGTRWHS